MAEHGSHEPIGPSEEQMDAAIAAGYEKEDVSIPVLVQWGLGLGVFLIATSIGATILFFVLQKPPFSQPALNETIVRNARATPPAGTPILQENPAGDPRPDDNPRPGVDNIREFRREEEIRMNEYATQDGLVHVPIDRAVEIGIKDFVAQKPGEPASGVTPTPEMKLNPPAPEPPTPTAVPATPGDNP